MQTRTFTPGVSMFSIFSRLFSAAVTLTGLFLVHEMFHRWRGEKNMVDDIFDVDRPQRERHPRGGYYPHEAQ